MSDDNAPGSEPQDDGEQGLMQLGKAGKVNRLLLFGLAGMLLLNLIAWVLVFVLGGSSEPDEEALAALASKASVDALQKEVAALQVLAVLCEGKRPASQVCQVFRPLPQLLRNVRFAGTSPLGADRVQEAIQAAEKRLKGAGRLLIRESGTEPLVRVMAEAEDHGLVTQIVEELCDVIRDETQVNRDAA